MRERERNFVSGFYSVIINFFKINMKINNLVKINLYIVRV